MSVTTYSMLSPPNPAFRTDSPRGGILLNAVRPQSRHQSPPNPPYIAPSSPSSSSTSSSDDSVNRKSSPTRRITFAPLPNPRALESLDQQLPVIVLDHTSDNLPYDKNDSALSLSGDDSNAAQGLTSSASSSPVLGAKKTSSWGYSTKKLFRPFYKPLQKAATLDVDGGGALGLFRASSRESNSSTGTFTDSGAPLARRMSTGSTPFHLGPTNHVVSDKNSLALTQVISDNGGVAAGTRLLNGRVYGRSRVRATQQEDHREPEFVEWGYGGMGSNRGTSASSAYAKVQSGHTNVVAEDDDDGSGMGWVRKRREAREREKREREEQEAKDKAQQQEHADSPSSAPAEDSTTEPVHDDATDSATITPEHITQTVAIPARPQPVHHHSKPPHSRRSSDSRLSASGTVTPVPTGSGRSTPMVSRMSNDSTHTVTSPAVAGPSSLRHPIEPDSSSSSSSSEDDEEDTEETTERDDDGQECDDDVEDDDDTEQRKTSRCAGVEKISRHKD